MKGRAVILAAALAAATSTAWAQEAAEEPVVIDPVVAIVDGAPIFASEILLLYQSLGPDVTRVAFATLYPQLLQGSIDRKLAAIRATADGLGAEPGVASKIRFWAERVLEEEVVNRWVEEALTDEVVLASYNALLAERTNVEEVRASHILVEEQAAAYAAVERLEAGEIFAELARELSIGPSGQNGGDIDFFQREQVVPAFSDVAFSLGIGEYTTEPVETQFGWHIILATDRRAVEPPTYEDVYQELRQQEGAALVDRFYAEITEGVEVLRFNFDGTPVMDGVPADAVGAPTPGREPPAAEGEPAAEPADPAVADEPAADGEPAEEPPAPGS